MSTIAELKVGDTVRLTHEGTTYSGLLATVEEIASDHNARTIIQDDPHKGVAWWIDNNTYPFEIVTSTDPEPSSMTDMGEVARLRAEVERLTSELSTERAGRSDDLRTVAYKAARIATSAGYCSEYDRIASAVGLPDRDELFTREYEHTVEVTFTVTVTTTSTDSDGPDWSTEDAVQVVNDRLGTNLSYYDVGRVEWETLDSQEGSLIDSETGETLSD